MNHLTLNRHYQVSHHLSEDALSSHPDKTGRILYFLLPFLFAFLANVAFFNRNLRVHRNFFVRTYPSNSYVFIAFLISLIGGGVIGIYAVVADAWTAKQWILYTIVCVLLGLKALVYTVDIHVTVFITAVITIFSAFVNEWLFIQLLDMPSATQDQIGWKHATRNFVGFIEAVLIIMSFQYLSESLVHSFRVSEKTAQYIFWVLAIGFTLWILIWNIISFGPFLDLIGYIVAALILFLGAFVNTLFYKGQDIQTLPIRQI